jgi:hypothetical protein
LLVSGNARLVSPLVGHSSSDSASCARPTTSVGCAVARSWGATNDPGGPRARAPCRRLDNSMNSLTPCIAFVAVRRDVICRPGEPSCRQASHPESRGADRTRAEVQRDECRARSNLKSATKSEPECEPSSRHYTSRASTRHRSGQPSSRHEGRRLLQGDASYSRLDPRTRCIQRGPTRGRSFEPWGVLDGLRLDRLLRSMVSMPAEARAYRRRYLQFLLDRAGLGARRAAGTALTSARPNPRPSPSAEPRQ